MQIDAVNLRQNKRGGIGHSLTRLQIGCGRFADRRFDDKIEGRCNSFCYVSLISHYELHWHDAAIREVESK